MFGGFKVENPLQDSVAQLVELCTFNAEVIGSSPIRVTKIKLLTKFSNMSVEINSLEICKKYG